MNFQQQENNFTLILQPSEEVKWCVIVQNKCNCIEIQQSIKKECVNKKRKLDINNNIVIMKNKRNEMKKLKIMKLKEFKKYIGDYKIFEQRNELIVPHLVDCIMRKILDLWIINTYKDI